MKGQKRKNYRSNDLWSDIIQKLEEQLVYCRVHFNSLMDKMTYVTITFAFSFSIDKYSYIQVSI